MSFENGFLLKQKSTHTVAPASRLAPQRGFEIPGQQEGLPPPLSAGHDFSRIAVNNPVPSAQSCPLSIAGPRACPFGGACHTCPARVQAKLAINTPGDEYEQEADRVAEQVMHAPAKPASSPSPNAQYSIPLQRKCAKCKEDDEDQVLQTKPLPSQDGSSERETDVASAVHETLRSPGRPIDPETRSFMESRFGSDFSRVRVHTDSGAAESARAVNALAYTVGRDVVFGAGQYAPRAEEGRTLLAHELAHTIQQQGVETAGPGHNPNNNGKQDPFGREANSFSTAASLKKPAAFIQASLRAPRLQRLGAGNKFLRLFGIEAGEFSNEDLKEYLDRITKNRQCDCGATDYLSDDMAREIVNRWGIEGFKLSDHEYNGVSSIDIRRMLIQEMLSGPTLGNDELAIIRIFQMSLREAKLEILDPTKGLSLQDIEGDINGDNKQEFFRVLSLSLPDLGGGHFTQSETPDEKSGACTIDRSIKIHFAQQRAEMLAQNALNLLDQFAAKPAENKNVEQFLECYFKAPDQNQIAYIREGFKSIIAVLPNLNYVCPADPFQGYHVTYPGGTRTLEPEPDLEAISLVEKAPQKTEYKVALFPEFFDTSPEHQASVVIHEALHHAYHQGDDIREFYDLRCGNLPTETALQNADSYAKFALALAQEGLQITFHDCPDAWKPAIIAATRTAEIWVYTTVSKLDAAVADPKNVDSHVSYLLNRHFKVTAVSEEMTQVREGFGEIQSAFSDEIPIECETECEHEDTVAYTGGMVVTPRGGRIHLCPHWFNDLNPSEQAETIVHEMAHRYAGKNDEVYMKGSFNTYKAAPADMLLGNADSYAQFAMNIGAAMP